MSGSFHNDSALARREVREVVDSETLFRYRRAAGRCNVPVQIVVKATEGQLYVDESGHSAQVSFGSTFITIVHPNSDLVEFWLKVSEVTQEALGGE